MIDWLTRKSRAVIALLILLTAATFFVSFANSSSLLSFRELRSGVVQAFAAEYRERLKIMRDPLQDTPEVAPFSVHPFSLVPWSEGTNELDTRMYAWYYGKTRIIPLPQFRPMAAPHRVPLVTPDGRELNLQSYLINDFNYVRLRDLAYVLRDVFDVTYNENGEYVILKSSIYTAVGGEMQPDRRWILAQLYTESIEVNRQSKHAVGYYIDGDMFWRMYHILRILEIHNVWHDGVLRLSFAGNIAATPSSITLVTQSGGEITLPSYLRGDSNYVRMQDLALFLGIESTVSSLSIDGETYFRLRDLIHFFEYDIELHDGKVWIIELE